MRSVCRHPSGTVRNRLLAAHRWRRATTADALRALQLQKAAQAACEAYLTRLPPAADPYDLRALYPTRLGGFGVEDLRDAQVERLKRAILETEPRCPALGVVVLLFVLAALAACGWALGVVWPRG